MSDFPVVVGTDGSPGALDAVEWAADEAAAGGTDAGGPGHDGTGPDGTGADGVGRGAGAAR